MLRLSTLLILVHSVLAVDNYCQWAPIWASGDTIINPFINGLYLFEPSDCDGTTCTIIRDDGASFNATDGQPTVGVAYTCDNNVYRSPTNFGAVIGSETHYMCTVRSLHMSAFTPKLTLLQVLWIFYDHISIIHVRRHNTTSQLLER